MNRSHANRFAMALRATLSLTSVTARGRESHHCRRLRDVTPQRLVCALVEALGAGRVETIAVAPGTRTGDKMCRSCLEMSKWALCLLADVAPARPHQHVRTRSVVPLEV